MKPDDRYDFDEDEAKEARQREREEFLTYCEENELDPEDEDSMEHYKEILAETGDAWWESLDEHDREGWEAMMTQDS